MWCNNVPIFKCTIDIDSTVYGSKCHILMIPLFCCLYVCSVNLMTCMGSLTTIVKQRPVYMKSVVQGFESLHGLSFVCQRVYIVVHAQLQSVYTIEYYHV